jgi:hypothetical protein
MTTQIISLCKRDIMSICTADSNEEQSRCSFYKKSSYKNKCMYFIFNSYCSCLKAQATATCKDLEYQAC